MLLLLYAFHFLFFSASRTNVLISIYYLFQLYQNKVSFSKLKELTLTTLEKYIMKRKYGMCYKHSSFLSKTFAGDTHEASSSCPCYRTKLPNWYFLKNSF